MRKINAFMAYLVFTVLVLGGLLIIAAIALAADAEQLAGQRDQIAALEAINFELTDQLEAAERQIAEQVTEDAPAWGDETNADYPSGSFAATSHDKGRQGTEESITPSAADGGSSNEGAIASSFRVVESADEVICLGAFEVTHYCVCAKCCDTETGTTASGRAAVPGYSIAVDRSVIPLDATVLADYGDGVLHEYRADDTGGAVKGAVIDLCVKDHETALALGRRTATVYVIEEKKNAK